MAVPNEPNEPTGRTPPVTLGDLQAFADALEQQELAPSSRVRTLAAVKSLLAFGQRTGYLLLNVGAARKLPPKKDKLAERILSETQVHRILALAALRWRDLQPRDDAGVPADARASVGQGAGQVTIFGNGGKTRVVLLPTSVWHELDGFGRSLADAPVFRSRRGGHLDPSAVERIVQKAATRAGIVGKVSPHWQRHAHATHALERQCPIHLVQATLGHASVACRLA